MEYRKLFLDFVDEKRKQFDRIKHQLKIILVSSSNSETGNSSNGIKDTENSILHLCKKFHIKYEYFPDENSFLKFVLMDKNFTNEKTIIYNQSFKGPLFSRRMLIPAFCGFNMIDYIGNDAYRMGLLCNKFHYYSILKNIGIPIADFWYYDANHGWIIGKPAQGLKVIMKLSNENNKISLNEESVFEYSDFFEDAIHSLSVKYKQGVILQKFIVGYEITIPAIIEGENIYTPNILGSLFEKEYRHGEKFFTQNYFENIRTKKYDDKYYDFDIINPNIKELIFNYSKIIINSLGVRGFTRIDARVDDSWGIFFNDVGCMPSITPGGAFECIFKLNGLCHEDFLITSICLTQ